MGGAKESGITPVGHTGRRRLRQLLRGVMPGKSQVGRRVYGFTRGDAAATRCVGWVTTAALKLTTLSKSNRSHTQKAHLQTFWWGLGGRGPDSAKLFLLYSGEEWGQRRDDDGNNTLIRKMDKDLSMNRVFWSTNTPKLRTKRHSNFNVEGKNNGRKTPPKKD